LAAVQIGNLVLEQKVQVIGAGDVAGATGTRTHRLQCLLHCREHRWVLAHAEIVVRTPDGDLGTDPVIKGPRKAAAAPLEIGKDAVAPLGAQRIETLFKEAFVIHYRRRAKTLQETVV